jgi:hypothetical protein
MKSLNLRLQNSAEQQSKYTGEPIPETSWLPFRLPSRSPNPSVDRGVANMGGRR